MALGCSFELMVQQESKSKIRVKFTEGVVCVCVSGGGGGTNFFAVALIITRSSFYKDLFSFSSI